MFASHFTSQQLVYQQFLHYISDLLNDHKFKKITLRENHKIIHFMKKKIF